MRGYPSHLNTSDDVENLLNMPEFYELCLDQLQTMVDCASPDEIIQDSSGNDTIEPLRRLDLAITDVQALGCEISADLISKAGKIQSQKVQVH